MRTAIAIFIGVIAFLVLNSIIPTKQECEIYNSTVRLHVIANSDSEQDQALKLKVRDAVLERMSTYNATSKEQALVFIENDKDELIKTAQECLKNEGFDYTVDIKITEEAYPTREYEDFTLPAGTYTSLKIIIGEGDGQNWWCVLYPPLCSSVAVEYDKDASVEVGLSKDQYNLITGSNGKYKVKLKLLELAAEAFGLDY